MAYMNQSIKQKLAPNVKAVLKKHGLSGTLKIRSNMALVLTIRSGWIDFGDTRFNRYHQDHPSSHVRQILAELDAAMNEGNWNNSMPQVDYFDVGWYTDIHISENYKLH